jgi:TrmH family RNA methyltransferase
MLELSKEKLKQILKLKTEKGREKEGRFLIEGLRLCEEAFFSDWEVELLLFPWEYVQFLKAKKLMREFLKEKRETLILSNQDIKKLTDTQTPQGIFAVVKKKAFTLNKDFLKKAALLVGLDNMRDPGNLGTIIRTADSAGADGILLSTGCVELYNPKVIRSTMGSIFHLPVIEKLELKEIIPELKSSGFKTFASDVRQGKDYTRLNYPEKTCLLIGSEAAGIRKEILNSADERIKIPIYGKAESLNASVAAGILLYEIIRIKKGNF